MKQKKTWMPLLLIGPISLITLFSCKDKGPDYVTEEFIYINTSQHLTYVLPYRNGKPGELIKIPIQQQYKETQVEIIEANLIINADSAEVVYDSVKVQKYTQDTGLVHHNLLFRNNYAYRYVDDHHEYTFTFDEASYNLADTIR